MYPARVFPKLTHGISVCLLIGGAVWSSPGIANAEEIRALLLAGFLDDCAIVTVQGKSLKPKPMMGLFQGDRITQTSGIDGIRIKCSPFTQVSKKDANTLEIVYAPPTKSHSLFGELKGFLGFEKEKHERKIAGTRDLPDMLTQIAEIITPQPGGRATALKKYPIRFCWKKNGEKILIFKDHQGSEFFTRSIPESNFIELTPEEIGMKPGETYFWEISVKGMPRNSESFSITRIDDSLDGIIRNDLAQIEAENRVEPSQSLALAAYCQFISDTFPGEIDLYWLSSQVLNHVESSQMHQAEARLLQMLIHRYLKHVEMQAANESL